MKKSLSRLLLLVSLILCYNPAEAKLAPDSYAFFTGYATGDLEDQGDYSLYPLFLGLGYRLPGPFMFWLEPFYSHVVSPQRNYETGINFALQVNISGGVFVQPYFKAGVGMVYVSQKTLYQHDGFNFNEYAGVGMRFLKDAPVSPLAEFRFRHVSNAGLADPNHGIDSYFFLAGVEF